MSLMALELSNGTTVTLTPNEQSQVYEFYRLHCTMERLTDVIEENGLNKEFNSDQDLKTVAQRVLGLKDDNHVSEDDAIHTVFDDYEYMENYWH